MRIAQTLVYCTSRSDGRHQTVQLDIPVSDVLTGIPQLFLNFLE